MKLSEFRKLIREEVRKYLTEKTQEEIDADKDSVAAQIVGAKAKLKAAQQSVKVAQSRIAMLAKKKSEVSAQKPSEEDEESEESEETEE